MAAISRRRLAVTTLALLKQHPKRRAKIIRSLAAYLIVHKQANQLPLLTKVLARELEISEKMVTAEVRTAFALTPESRKHIQNYIKKTSGAQYVEMEENVDPALLSGVVIRTADTELDTTARRALVQLASLNSGGKS